jgi:acyl carrier protein
MNALVDQLKRQIIEALNLEDVTPEQIDPAEPLFSGKLGLDSIDALELVVMLERQYGIRIKEAAVGKQAFSSVNNLADFVAAARQTP